MSKQSIYTRYIPAVTNEYESSNLAYWFIFSSNKLLIKVDNNKVSIPYSKTVKEFNITPISSHYLGQLQESPCYTIELAIDSGEPEGMSYRDLRSLYGAIDEDIFMLAGKALQIVSWHQTHQYCGRCGAKTEPIQGERAKICPKCSFISYPRISPAAITAILKGNKILLAHSSAFSGNMHSLIAGFVEPGETLEECVKREIKEEVGLQVKNINYFGSQPWPFPNSLMIGFTAEYESGEISVDGVEITAAGWFDKYNLPELPSKVSIAREIIEWYLKNY